MAEEIVMALIELSEARLGVFRSASELGEWDL
jgi:hypothetical protein